MLLVEDSLDDADLVQLALRRGGYAPRLVRVDNEVAFLDALERGGWEIIISNYCLPSGIRQRLRNLFNADLARVTFSRISLAFAVQMSGFGSRFCLAM